jgi:hypothetical protein
VLEGEGDSRGIEEMDEAGDGAPPPPRSSPFEVADLVVHIRWRACFGDMEKNAIPAVYNTARSKHFWEIREPALWEWVAGVIDDLKPRRIKITTLCAVVYPPRQPKRDRAIKTLR